ncbi:adenine nucleotide transporter BT1, chloroplastic/mitochondrial-like [Salvia miltiorrhiza]|uniref:adenine nucleotide transporter BT1, chloroplastic/mitochondrial-like n=1 Tax=Salvia miltiorrhiza TaxID=226208 RepID=UPI0025ABBE7C|nr:adenine nucleotide transporter BT1, chloroplastic/mitochondrial-like [Salvia miltiorrhiza]XP_057799918.1 adenine nucleotide transporter BT1, chloroplastic/mitochondrial-like [Salvia miltiorrhiza]
MSVKMQSLEFNKKGLSSSNSNLGLQWNLQDCNFYPGGGLFASVSQMGNNENGGFKLPYADLLVKYVSLPEGFKTLGLSEEESELVDSKKKNKGLKLKIKVSNPSLRRLISGGIAGAVSRTAVAPLETIRTHLMVGSSGNSSTEVFQNIMQSEGWKGLFRGNFVNVIRVAPSKAIELFVYDTVNRNLSSKPGEQQRLLVPPSLVAGACAGVSSTLITYPLELVKTRLTIQRGVYNGLFDAFVKIFEEGGLPELYRGLTPSLIGVIPYAAANYCAYDTLRKAYRKIFKQEKIGNIETLLIGSAAGAISSTATFPLEVARKHMQVGAVSGRHVYKNMLHALASILQREGLDGLYRGLGPSCLKLVPAAGISFMCYEACKRILVEKEADEE